MHISSSTWYIPITEINTQKKKKCREAYAQGNAVNFIFKQNTCAKITVFKLVLKLSMPPQTKTWHSKGHKLSAIFLSL